MRNRFPLIFSVLFYALAGQLFFGPLASAAITKNDFAYGINVTASSNQLHEFTLPEHVYATVQNKSLSDLRIFSPNGSIVPYVIVKQTPANSSTQKQETAVNIFPVRQMESQPISDLNLFVQRDDKGTIVNINSSDFSDKNKGRTFYIVDLGKNINVKISALKFDWNTSQVDQASLIISSSTDLSNWVRSGSGSVFHLKHGGHLLQRNEIPIHRLSRYLKIYSNKNPNWKLSKLYTVENREIQENRKLNWISVKLLKKFPNRFIYQVNTMFPAKTALITPQKATTIYDIEIKTGNEIDNISTSLYRGLVYRMKMGNETLTSSPIPVNHHGHMYWQIEIFDKDNDNNPPPQFNLAWQPHVIRFLSNEGGTYTIGYGNTSIKHHGTSLPPNIYDKDFQTVQLKLTQPETLGGTEKIQPEPATVSYTKPILWSVLILVLVVMGYMVIRLTRHMKE